MLKFVILFFLLLLFSFEGVSDPKDDPEEIDYEILDLNDDYGC